jgi:hypothetical protein
MLHKENNCSFVLLMSLPVKLNEATYQLLTHLDKVITYFVFHLLGEVLFRHISFSAAVFSFS